MCKVRKSFSVLPVALVLALLGASEPASAHAFGQRYDLPVPLELYLLGAAATVVFSFVVIAAFVGGAPHSGVYPRVNLLRYRLGRLLAHRLVLLVIKLGSVGLFLLVILAGFIGDQHPLRNLAPALVWIIGWVGLAYVSAFVGNVWVLLNPWRTLFGWADALYRRIRPEHALSLHLPYPDALGVWPGLFLLLAFSWIELVFPEPATPINIAWIVVGYSLITWTGMFLFGRERWLRQGEAFSLVFALLARFGPTEVGVARTNTCKRCGLQCRDRDRRCVDCYQCFDLADERDREWTLRPYAAGLLRDEPVSTSMMAFVLLVLSLVLFDGFLATPEWWNLWEWLRPFSSSLEDAYDITVKTLGLIVFWLLFLGAYLATCFLMTAVSVKGHSTGEIARIFAFTLVPIAIAYHLAHYLTYLLIQGQYIIPLASDPFGYDWDLFGTAGYRVDIAVVGARFAWYTAVITIVMGHIVAVYLAHNRAMRLLPERRSVLRSQYPMTALMVAYTVTSLSILAEPIVETRPAAATTEAREPALVRIPADAVLPRHGSGQLIAVGTDKYAKAKLTYKSMVSVFHDGTRATTADILYPYMLAYRWGTHSPDQKTNYDPYIDKSTALIRGRLVGLRTTGVDKTSKSSRFGDFVIERELQVIEVYLSTAPDKAQSVTAVAPPWSSVPWHVLVLMEQAVKRGWAAFSQSEATRQGVAWLDLVRTNRTQMQQFASLIEEFERRGHVPQPLKGLVNTEQARARWTALKTFYEKRGHFLVTNGPYTLKSWSENTIVLKVFRDLSYPLGVGSYDAYSIPRRAYIRKIEQNDAGLRVFAEVEKIERIQRSYQIVRRPFRVATGGSARTDTLACRYVVVTADGQVRLAGDGHVKNDGTVAVELRGKLEPDLYTIMVALYLNDNTMNPDIKRISYEVTRDS
ncbi:MAG: hypothetical protein ACE5K1_11425 [Acidiferrobacterales bacterium]